MIVHCLPLGDVGRDFALTGVETRRHFSYLSAFFLVFFICIWKLNKIGIIDWDNGVSDRKVILFLFKNHINDARK